MEYLCANNHSKASISNYMAAICAFHIIYALDNHPFKHECMSLQITAPLIPRIRTTLDIEILTSIVTICDDLEAPAVFKSLYLTCFFSFLRLSNLLPHTVKTFDVTRQLTRGDLIITKESAAFRHAVPLEHIMKHGTWKSDAIWTYLSSSVALAFISTCPTSLVPTWVWVVLIFTLYTVNTQYRQYDTNINTNFNIFKYNPLYGLSAGNTLTSIAGHFTLPCVMCQFDLDL